MAAQSAPANGGTLGLSLLPANLEGGVLRDKWPGMVQHDAIRVRRGVRRMSASTAASGVIGRVLHARPLSLIAVLLIMNAVVMQLKLDCSSSFVNSAGSLRLAPMAPVSLSGHRSKVIRGESSVAHELLEDCSLLVDNRRPPQDAVLPPFGKVAKVSKEQLDLILTKEEDVIVMLAFTWCRPCKKFWAKYQKLAQIYDKTTFLKVVGDENDNNLVYARDILKVAKTPMFAAYRAGLLVDTWTGANLARFKEHLEDAFASARCVPEEAKKPLQKAIDAAAAEDKKKLQKKMA
eukprot:TRINITY_DN112130_c0_g1_i1.p1 TRINITY_DN112130_c0_g1~~TRINITY_DN112130_c0_g1_i1.p1  ORF type:complete len:329 (+),score=20.84 TRINITY_DN112130_c0_g1_i1:116-988(+)